MAAICGVSAGIVLGLRVARGLFFFIFPDFPTRYAYFLNLKDLNAIYYDILTFEILKIGQALD